MSVANAVYDGFALNTAKLFIKLLGDVLLRTADAFKIRVAVYFAHINDICGFK